MFLMVLRATEKERERMRTTKFSGWFIYIAVVIKSFESGFYNSYGYSKNIYICFSEEINLDSWWKIIFTFIIKFFHSSMKIFFNVSNPIGMFSNDVLQEGKNYLFVGYTFVWMRPLWATDGNVMSVSRLSLTAWTILCCLTTLLCTRRRRLNSFQLCSLYITDWTTTKVYSTCLCNDVMIRKKINEYRGAIAESRSTIGFSLIPPPIHPRTYSDLTVSAVGSITACRDNFVTIDLISGSIIDVNFGSGNKLVSILGRGEGDQMSINLWIFFWSRKKSIWASINSKLKWWTWVDVIFGGTSKLQFLI